MARKDAFESLTHPGPHAPADVKHSAGRVLIHHRDPQIRSTIKAALTKLRIAQSDAADATTDIRRLYERSRYEILVVDFALAELDGWETVRLFRKRYPFSRILVIGERPQYEDAMTAIRAGAIDYLLAPVVEEELEDRLQNALDQALLDRQRDASIRRLKRICRKLNHARLDVTSQIDDLCNDLVNAYDELAGQISHVTTVTEFTAIIRQELDVEDLLRTTLEYFLRKIGPMNAAVFLPGTADEFTLGAYINYDCPRDSADFMLDQLADVIPSRLADEQRVLEFRSNGELESWLGDDAHWLKDSHVVTFSCRHENECLAVFTLFRNMETPFDEQFVPLMESVAEVFGEQLAHVIHVHHRALPPDEDDHAFGSDWSGESDDDEDFDPGDHFGDLAA